MRLLACLLIAGLAIVRFEPAFAHAFLERASPLASSTLQSAPPIVTMTFSVPIEPRFSVIEVQDGQGNRMDSGPVRMSDGKSIAIDLVTLAAGNHIVNWQALPADTHRTRGHFEFSVRP